VGTLGVIDSDKVEVSNLHRQVVHFTEDEGKQKVSSAKEKIKHLNPHVKVVTYPERLNAKNALEIFEQYDLIVDGTDNFPSRYLINDAAVMLKKPFVFGGIFRFEGQCSVFGLPDGPCYRCFFQEPPQAGDVPSCVEAGVVGVLPGIVGLLQANEVIKMICGIGEPLKGRLLIFDGLSTRFREIQIKKDKGCRMCGQDPKINKLVEEGSVCQTRIGKKMADVPEITVQELKKLLDKKPLDVCIIDVREQNEWDMAHINGAVLKPTSTLEENYQDIPKDRTVYFHCKGGGRSSSAIQFLKSKGYKNNLVNIKGGIKAWAKEIDPKMAQY